ncbi:WD-40 repeat-containing protein MSI3 [Glycine max]|nr:WD-40 repeat-containing protein MSI3 [Glycine max]
MFGPTVRYTLVLLCVCVCLDQFAYAAQLIMSKGHENVVEDVPWNLKDENMFGSSEDDCKLIIWDLRTNKAQQSVKPHEKENRFSTSLILKWLKVQQYESDDSDEKDFGRVVYKL